MKEWVMPKIPLNASRNPACSCQPDLFGGAGSKAPYILNTVLDYVESMAAVHDSQRRRQADISITHREWLELTRTLGTGLCVFAVERPPVGGSRRLPAKALKDTTSSQPAHHHEP
jgi:hypothetical protein